MPSVDLEPAHGQKPSKVKVGDPLIQLKINYETFYRCYPARPFAARTWSRFSLYWVLHYGKTKKRRVSTSNTRNSSLTTRADGEMEQLFVWIIFLYRGHERNYKRKYAQSLLFRILNTESVFWLTYSMEWSHYSEAYSRSTAQEVFPPPIFYEKLEGSVPSS